MGDSEKAGRTALCFGGIVLLLGKYRGGKREISTNIEVN